MGRRGPSLAPSARPSLSPQVPPPLSRPCSPQLAGAAAPGRGGGGLAEGPGPATGMPGLASVRGQPARHGGWARALARVSRRVRPSGFRAAPRLPRHRTGDGPRAPLSRRGLPSRGPAARGARARAHRHTDTLTHRHAHAHTPVPALRPSPQALAAPIARWPGPCLRCAAPRRPPQAPPRGRGAGRAREPGGGGVSGCPRPSSE